jgi:predicted transcriptional regulator
LSVLRHDQLDVLKLLIGAKLTPWQIAEKSRLNVKEVQQLVTLFLRNGLVAITSDGFSSYLELTKEGFDLVNER